MDVILHDVTAYIEEGHPEKPNFPPSLVIQSFVNKQRLNFQSHVWEDIANDLCATRFSQLEGSTDPKN